MEKNKELVYQLLQTTFNEKNVKAAAELLTDDYVQHNPNVPTGKEGFLRAIPGFYSKFPDLKWTLKKIWNEEDCVIVHSHYQFAKKGNGSAVVDIFRIKDGKIDEHWDVTQDIPDMVANTNTMF